MAMFMANSKHRGLLALVFGVLLLGGVLAYVERQEGSSLDIPTAPEQETVATPVPDTWFVTATLSAQFRHPESIEGTYLYAENWPPTVEVIDAPFSCDVSGAASSDAAKTELRTIGGHQYCVSEVREGAAGSTFVRYTYAFPEASKTALMTFALQLPRCENYTGEEQTACEEEQGAFDPDSVVDRMAGSLVLR